MGSWDSQGSCGSKKDLMISTQLNENTLKCSLGTDRALVVSRKTNEFHTTQWKYTWGLLRFQVPHSSMKIHLNGCRNRRGCGSKKDLMGSTQLNENILEYYSDLMGST